MALWVWVDVTGFEGIGGGHGGSPAEKVVCNETMIGEIIRADTVTGGVARQYAIARPSVLTIVGTLVARVSTGVSRNGGIILSGFKDFGLNVEASPTMDTGGFARTGVGTVCVVCSPCSIVSRNGQMGPVLDNVGVRRVARCGNVRSGRGNKKASNKASNNKASNKASGSGANSASNNASGSGPDNNGAPSKSAKGSGAKSNRNNKNSGMGFWGRS